MNTLAVRPRRAFTLLETLLAVLVLGLGLLGLASVVPAVVAQQRDASETIRAGSIAAAIDGQVGPTDGLLRGLIEQADVTYRNNLPYGFGAGTTAHYFYNPANPGSDRPFSFLWELDWAWNYIDETGAPQNAGLSNNTLQRYRIDGGLRFSGRNRNDRDFLRAQSFGPLQGPDIPVAARLIPPPVPAAGDDAPQPRFVWDLVPRRDANGEIQVAIFVRRVSTGLRSPGNRTLSETLTGVTRDGTPIPPDEWRLPLGYDFNQRRILPNGAAATNSDGQNADYAVPMGAAARVLRANRRFRAGTGQQTLVTDETVGRYIEVAALGTPTVLGPTANVDNRPPRGPDDFDFLAQPGQLFVDNLGTVRRVEEVFRDPNADGALISLEVDPPYNAGAVSNVGIGGAPNPNDGPGAFTSELRQLVFTPQIPVSIPVRTLSR